MCALAIDIVAEARDAFLRLRHSRTANHALVLRADVNSLKVEVDADYPDGRSLDDIADSLPSTEPRFIIIMPERSHPDGRKSYPLVLIVHCPAGLSPQVNIVYSNARTIIARDFQLNLVWEVKKLLQLGDDELQEKFATGKW
jgi:hypothetical protein